MNEEVMRIIVAQLTAHEALINALLRFSFDPDFTAEEVRKLGEAIKANANDTSGYTGIAKGDEAGAERLADTVVQMQQEVARIVDSAVQAFVAVKSGQR